MAIVYKIWNECTGKSLIGVTRKDDITPSFKEWMGNCRRERYKDYLISKDFALYGKQSFYIEKIAEHEVAADAFEIADSYIIQLNTLEPNGYNKSFTGIRKTSPNFYNDENSIPQQRKQRKREENKKKLLAEYGLEGIVENNIPQLLATPQSIKMLRRMADRLEAYGNEMFCEFVPADLSKETNAIGEFLLEFIDSEQEQWSKENFVLVKKSYTQCQRCGKYRPEDVYFTHPDKSATHDGLIHLCKDCIEKYETDIYNSCGSVFYTILSICQLTNLIFVQELATNAEKSWIDNGSKDGILQYYLAELRKWLGQKGVPSSMLEFRNSNFRGDIFSFAEHHPLTPEVFIEELNRGLVKGDPFEPQTEHDALVMKWGSGFDKKEYVQLEQEYKKLEKFLPKKTDLHIEALKKYVIYSLKEKSALAKGDLKDVKEWNSLADKAADNAQLKIKQLSENFGAEVDGFAKLVEAVEEYASVIPVLPKVRKMPYDDIDFIIWEIVNYTRRLEGKPEASYEEVYNFIDEELTKKMIDSGMSEEDVAKAKEQRNAIFNDLSDNYIEPLWLIPDSDEDEEGDDE